MQVLAYFPPKTHSIHLKSYFLSQIVSAFGHTCFMHTSCIWFSFYLGLLPYLVAQRIRTCPSLGSPHTGTPLQLLSPLSALHIPTSTLTWTISGLCIAAHPSPWSLQPGGWAPQMVSVRPTHSASTYHATSAASPGTWYRVALMFIECFLCPKHCAKCFKYMLSFQL